MALARSALLFALLGSALAGPIMVSDSSIEQCAATCPATTKFGYEEGKTYRYNYESDILTHIPGADTEQSKLTVSALVHIEVISKCEMLLKLTDVKLADANPENTEQKNNVERAWDFKRSLQERGLRFAFQDGSVSSVCPEAGEEKWVLNIKRAILSGFQNTMNDLSTNTRNKEADVSGECYVEYSSAASWSGYTITKVKDVLSCSRHAHYDSLFQTAAFDVSSRIQSLPLLRSTHECTQTINSKNVLSATKCEEKHVFRPFSTSESGATTQVSFSLELQTTVSTGRSQRGELSSRESLIFDYEPTSSQPNGNNRNVNQVRQALTTICSQTETRVGAEAPATFHSLVHKMRDLTPDQLENLHQQIKASPMCDRAEKFFHDAIPSLGTSGSARLIRVLLTSGEIGENEADLWLTSLAFITRPTKELLTDIKQLLVQNVSFRKSTLAVTSLVHNYCQIHSDCADHMEVKQILNVLDEALGYNCAATSHDQHQKILAVLKGIGNAGHAERIVAKLNRCILNAENDMEIRVAAVQAFRRMACTSERSEVMNVFLSTNTDAELRINAYIMLMACPTEDILQRVKSHLEHEDVNQVGSFVWTHLTNLMETASPFKQEIRLILQTETLKKTFNLDKRKFSRNIEWSAFSDSLNAGATVESNLIWSPKSFVPRSANLNLTLDMFGQSLNLIEVGGRSEGIDTMLESLFGPTKDIDNHIPERKRRDASNLRIDPLHNEYDLKRDTSKGSYYVRMFGNEISFDDFHEFSFSNVKENTDWKPLLKKLSEPQNIDYTRSGMFFDTAMVVPTVAGLPLKLKTDGTAVVNMKVRGKFDVRNLLKPTSAMHIEGSVRPSAAVQVNGEMSVDAMMAKTGLRMVNNMKTDTLADGKIELKDGAIFNMDINLPDDRLEVFTASSKFFVEYRDTPREQAMLTAGRIEKRACFDGSIVRMTGLELCGEVSLPHAYKVKSAPWYPFTGPSSASLVLNKRDTFTAFHFDAKYVKEQVSGSDGTKNIARVSFNTPGSRVDREFTFEYTLDKPAKMVEVSLKTPFKTMEFTGSLTNTDSRKQIKATGKLDSDTYDLLARVNIEKNRYNIQYRPLVEVSLPGRQPYRMDGSVLYRKGKKADVDLKIENIFEDPLTFKGDVNYIKKDSKYFGSIQMASSVVRAKVNGSVTTGDNNAVTSDIQVTYQKGSGRRHTMRSTMEWRAPSLSKTSPNAQLKTAFISTQWPRLTSDLDVLIDANLKQGRFELDAGRTGTRQRITISNSHKINHTNKQKTGEVMVSMAIPFKDIDLMEEITYTMTKESLQFTGKHRSGSALTTVSGKAERQSTKPLKTLIELSLTGPGRNHVFRDTVIESSTGRYDHELVLDLQPDWKAEMTSYYKRLPRHEISADIKIPSLKPVKIEGHFKPDFTDFSTEGEVKYGRDVYSTGANWKFTKDGQEFASDSKFELVYPQRSIIVKTKLNGSPSSTTSESEVKWDAVKDPTKRFMIKTDSNHGNPGSMNLRAEWLAKKFVDLTITRKHSQPAGSMEGKVVFTSSYRKARSIMASFAHESNTRQMTTKAEVSWDNNQKINTDIILVKRKGLRDAVLTIKTTTPFEKFSTATYVLDYSLRGNTFDSKNRFDWNDKFAELTITGKGDVANHDFEGGVRLTSSYDEWNGVAVSGKHRDNGKLFESQLQGTWRDGSTMSGSLNMNHNANGWYITNSGDISVSLPFGPYRNNKFIWSHQNDGKVLKSHGELQLDAEKSVFDLDTAFKFNRKARSLNIRTTFTSPYENARDLALSFDHQSDPRHFEGITTSGSVKWAPSKVISFTKKVDYKPGEFVKKDLVITTPFNGYERITFDMENKLEGGDRFTFHKELKWGPNKKMALDGFVILTAPETSAEIRFLSTFDNADRFFVSLENKPVNNVWQTNVRLEYPRNKKIEASSQIGWTKSIKCRLQLTTPYEQVDNFVFDLNHKGPSKNFVTTVDVEVPQYGKSSLKLESDVRRCEDIDIQATFSTDSYERLSSAKLAFTHKKSGDTYRTGLDYEHPGYKASIGNTFTKTPSSIEFDERLILTHQNSKIETGIKLETDPVMNLNLFYKRPSGKYSNVIFNFNLDKRTNTVAVTQLTYEGNRLAATMQYANNKGSITGSLVVETPFAGYERSSLSFQHSGKWNNFKNTGSLSVGGRDFNAENEFLYRSTRIKVISKLTTPYERYQTFSIDFDHSGEVDDMKQDLELIYGETNIKITHEFKNKNDRINHKFLIVTPYSMLSSLKLELKHNGPWNNFKNEGTFEYNGNIYSGSSEFKSGARATKGSITINTPDKYTVSFVHKGENTDFTNNVQADMNGRAFSANTVFKLNRRALELTSNIRTPYRQFRVMRATINHRGPRDNFQSNFDFNINNNMYTGEGELKLNGNEITGSANFKFPETYSMTFTHKGPILNFENNMVIHWDREKYEAASSFSKERDTLAGSISVKVPTEYSLTFGHTGNLIRNGDSSSDFRLLLNGHITTGNSRIHYRENALTMTTNLQLPIESYKKFGLSIKHRGVASNFKTEATLNLPFAKVKKLGFEVEHSSSLPEFSSQARVIYNKAEYGFSVSHEGNINDFTSKAGIEHKGKKVQAEIKWTQTGSGGNMNHNGHIRLMSPYKHLRTVETKFTHSIQGTSYRGQIESLYNDATYFDTEYTFSNEQKKELTLTMREPNPASFSGNFELTPTSLETDATVNWDTTDPNSNVQMVMMAKSEPKYEFEIKVIRPEKTTMFKTDLDYENKNFDHGVAVQWGNGPAKKADYRMTGEKSRGIYNGQFELRSPYQNLEASVEHTVKAQSVQTVFEIGNIEKLTVIQKMSMKQPNFRNFDAMLTVKHPRLQKDIKFEMEGIVKPRPYAEGRVNIEFGNDKVTFTGKVGDISTSAKTSYIAAMRLIHPGTFTDFQFDSEFGAERNEVFANMEVKHKSAVDKTIKTASLRSSINTLRRKLNLDVVSPLHDDVRLTGAIEGDSGEYKMTLAGDVGGERISANLDLSKKAPLADLRIKYQRDRLMRMYAKYISVSTVQFEAYRQIGNNKIIDSQLALRLNNSRLIHGRAYFRPESASEIQELLNQNHGVEAFFQRVKNAIDEDIEHRERYLRSRIQPIISFLRDLLHHLDDIERRVERAYNAAYRNDHYYMKSSHEMAKKHYNQISAYTQEQYMKYKPAMDRHYENMAQSWEDTKQAVAIRHAHVTNTVNQMHGEFMEDVRRTYNVLSERIEAFITAPWFSIIEEKLTTLYENAYNRLRESGENFRNHPYVRPVIEWFDSVKDSEYFQPLRDFHRDATEHMANLRRRYNNAYSTAYRKLSETMDTEEMRKVQEWAQDLVRHGKYAYQYYGLADIEETIRNLRASNIDELKTKALRYLRDYLQLNRTRITVWDTNRGDYQFEAYMPIKLQNLRDFPVEEVRRLVTKTKRNLAFLMPDEEWIPWDTIYKYKISTDPQSWIPPFDAHATLAGSQHFMTFDKKFYEYSGECSYLLAHDFINSNFSVVVNYDSVDGKMSKKSITVLSNGKQVEIFSSYKVTIDGARSELPIEFDDTSVVRLGNRIRLDNTNGITVTCDLPYDRCTVNVTGWYFAKTAGLFGTYNNEPFDDFTTPLHRLATSPEILADSWTVGRKCRVRNNAEQRVLADARSYKTCAKYFMERQSPFRPCFRQVDHEPFMQMCVNDLAKRDNQLIGESDICDVAAFYVDECARHGVPLRQPRACVSCKLGDARKFKEGNDLRLDGSDVPQSADIVFVISHKQCNGDIIPKLKKVLDSLEDSLKERGLRRNRYGVVGFGGDGILATPHSHTIEGQLFNRHLKVGQMITSLPVSSDDQSVEHAIDALHMAARYPFRAGVSKTLILVNCDTCSENLVSYPDMVELLLKRDIRLQLISPHDFRMKSNSPKANNILAMTRYTVYTNKHVGNLDGDVTLRRQVLMPKDLCAALSHDTEGAIFNANKFTNARWKDIRTILASVVAVQAAPSECQTCECVPDESGLGQPVCYSCTARKPLYGLLPKFEDYGVGNFMDVPSKPIKKVKKLKSLSKKGRRRGRNQ